MTGCKIQIKKMQGIESHKGCAVLDLSISYLHLVKNVVGENIKGGNLWIYFGDKLADGEYDEKTKWSDFNVSNPLFFNFYHGLELLLKGFLLLKDNYILKADYKITKLLNDFRENYSQKIQLISILNKYLTIELLPSYIADCLNENNIQVDDLYEFFRYPLDKKFQTQRDYSRIRFKEEEGLKFFEDFIKDINALSIEAVKLSREIDAS